jgi:hypothetical protein
MANTGVFSSTQMLSRFFVASRLLYFLCCLIALCSLASSAAAQAPTNVLTWTDNSNNESGFRIDRKIGTNGTFAELATVGSNVTSYTDSNVTAGNTYCYRVNAFNSAGASAYTGELCKTVPVTSTFNFALINGGNKSVNPGQSVTNTITANLSSGSSQTVTFSTVGIPAGATASYTTSTFCSPTCSRTLNIATSAATPAGAYPVTVSAAGGGITRTTGFTLTVTSTTLPPTGGDLVSHWTFDEASGASAADASGNGRTATLINGTRRTAGKFGTAVLFDGANDYVSTPYGNGINPATAPQTFTMWIKPQTGTTTRYHIFFGTNNGTNRRLYLGKWNGRFCIGIQASGCSGSEFTVTQNWTFLALVMDKTTATLYVNGVKGTSAASVKNYTSYTLASNIAIGKYGTDTQREFAGAIDDVRIYNQALSQSQIQSLYNGNGGVNLAVAN